MQQHELWSYFFTVCVCVWFIFEQCFPLWISFKDRRGCFSFIIKVPRAHSKVAAANIGDLIRKSRYSLTRERRFKKKGAEVKSLACKTGILFRKLLLSFMGEKYWYVSLQNQSDSSCSAGVRSGVRGEGGLLLLKDLTVSLLAKCESLLLYYSPGPHVIIRHIYLVYPRLCSVYIMDV